MRVLQRVVGDDPAVRVPGDDERLTKAHEDPDLGTAVEGASRLKHDLALSLAFDGLSDVVQGAVGDGLE